MSGWQPAVKDKYFRKRVKGPLLQPMWNAQVEVPYGLRVGSPLPMRIWGAFMCEWRLGEGLGQRNHAAYAMWCAAQTLFAQDVCKELLDGLHCGRLWYIPPDLIDGMRAITYSALAGGDEEIATCIGRALYFVQRVKWHLVDGAA